MGKENKPIKYGINLEYDRKLNCLLVDGNPITLYEAFRQLSVMPNQTPENLKSLLMLTPDLNEWQLKKLLYCCASRFCADDTDDYRPQPTFSLNSDEFKSKKQWEEIRQLVIYGCLIEKDEEKPRGICINTQFDNNRYFLDWGFLKQLKSVDYGPLRLSAINKLDSFERSLHYNYKRETICILSNGQLEEVNLLDAFHICKNNHRYKSLENIAVIRNMFPSLSEFQFNVVVLYINGDKKEWAYSELVKKVPPFNMDEQEKVSELSRLFHLGVIHCEFVNTNLQKNIYELSSTFLNKIHSCGTKKIKLEVDCPIGNIIFPDELKEETLFYNADVLQSLEEIKEYLLHDNYKRLEEHFEKELGRLSFASLLEGPSGTGKTAFVKEIARCTGRPIIFVDIAKLRGGHWGDDEKGTRAIFDEYLFRSCTMPIKPILFVDECDTILAKRQNPDGDINSSLVNGINTSVELWLQELDKFDGILFLTTNNANHMDEAIARRLLFQVHIGHPDEEIQVKLWQHFFPAMSESEAKEMANTTNFTGGQILKVKEKVKLKEILRGSVPFEELKRICGTNGKIQKRNPIGFGR